MQKPKAILLDWDNTLASSWGIIHKCLNITFKAFGKEEWPFEDLMSNRNNIHHSLRDSFPRMFGEDWENAREVYYDAFKKCHLEEISFLEGAEESIKMFAKTGSYIAIVSNKTGEYLRQELKHLGIDNYFHKIIGATDAELDKPHPEPLLMALEGSGIERGDFANHVWMVGDSKTDIEAALNTGVIPVAYGEAEFGRDLSDKIKYRIKDHKEFQDIIRSWG